MDYIYEDGVKTTVEQHIKNLHEILREAISCNDDELLERGYFIEEVGRFIDRLYEEHETTDIIEVFYHDGLNAFEIIGEGIS